MSLLKSKCWFKKKVQEILPVQNLKNQNEWAGNWIDWNPMERKSKSLDPFTSTVIGIWIRDTESTFGFVTYKQLIGELIGTMKYRCEITKSMIDVSWHIFRLFAEHPALRSERDYVWHGMTRSRDRSALGEHNNMRLINIIINTTINICINI